MKRYAQLFNSAAAVSARFGLAEYLTWNSISYIDIMDSRDDMLQPLCS